MSNKHYLTLEEGTDYRSLADMMSKSGWQMNHATARNFFFLTLRKFIKEFANNLGVTLTKSAVDRLLENPEFHECLTDVLYLAKDKKEKQNNDL